MRYYKRFFNYKEIEIKKIQIYKKNFNQHRHFVNKIIRTILVYIPFNYVPLLILKQFL